VLDFPAIPDPGNTIESVAEAVRAIKFAIETLTSQTGEKGGEAAHIFKQAEPPTEFLNGAIWINTAKGNQIYAYEETSKQWLNTTAQPASGSVDLSPYLLKTGGTITGSLDITGSETIAGSLTVAYKAQIANAGGANTSQSDGSGTMEIRNNGGTGDGDVACITFHCTGQYAMKMHLRADGYFGFGGWSRAAWVLYTDPSNNLYSAGNVTAGSDARLKDDIVLIEDAYEVIRHMHGYRFTWNNRSSLYEARAGKRDVGILAHEVKAVLPEIVSPTMEDPVTAEVYDTVCYEKLTPVLIEVIHDLMARVVSLEAALNGRAA